MSAGVWYLPIIVYIFKGLSIVNGEHTEESLPCPHVLVPHCTVLLLTRRVEDVQQTCLPIDNYLLSV